MRFFIGRIMQCLTCGAAICDMDSRKHQDTSSGHHSAGAMPQEAHYNNVMQWKRKAASAFELERSLYAAHVVGECRVNLHALLHLRTAVNHG